MPKYVVLETGVGEGCDYTIDCNKHWWFFEAKNMKEAKKRVAFGEWFEEEDFPELEEPFEDILSEIDLERLQIIEINKEFEFNIPEINKKAKELEKIKQEEEIMQEELKTLERLKEKYSNVK